MLLICDGAMHVHSMVRSCTGIQGLQPSALLQAWTCPAHCTALLHPLSTALMPGVSASTAWLVWHAAYCILCSFVPCMTLLLCYHARVQSQALLPGCVHANSFKLCPAACCLCTCSVCPPLPLWCIYIATDPHCAALTHGPMSRSAPLMQEHVWKPTIWCFLHAHVYSTTICCFDARVCAQRHTLLLGVCTRALQMLSDTWSTCH